MIYVPPTSATSSPTPIPLHLLIIPTALFIVGILLVHSARRRRVGVIPHCRNCDYVLVGNQSAVCPECGQAITPQLIIYGDRIRLRSLWIGWIMALVSLILIAVILTPSISQYDWYRWRPVSWVIQDSKSSNHAQAMRGWQELDRRRAAGSLSDVNEQQLVQFTLSQQALAHQPGAVTSPILSNLLDYVGDRALEGKLTDAQKKQFFENALRFKIRLRPQVLANAPYSVEISSVDTAPSSGFWVEIPQQSVFINQQLELKCADAEASHFPSDPKRTPK